MPYVTVVFDPQKLTQSLVDSLKLMLQTEVAFALSSNSARIDPTMTDDINTPPEEIMVVQHATHPTDVNVPPLEIYIEAGRPKGRSGARIVKMLGQAISELDLIPSKHLGEGRAGIFIVFHERNDFGFIPRRN